MREQAAHNGMWNGITRASMVKRRKTPIHPFPLPPYDLTIKSLKRTRAELLLPHDYLPQMPQIAAPGKEGRETASLREDVDNVGKDYDRRQFRVQHTIPSLVIDATCHRAWVTFFKLDRRGGRVGWENAFLPQARFDRSRGRIKVLRGGGMTVEQDLYLGRPGFCERKPREVFTYRKETGEVKRRD
ncbi:hypothetical protein R1flu_011294 [Riccia fluitans]|uniref:Uncharacterized protein n=1 Tax=Riccia fluitans TaxID=41844 RepID=A0ABD1Z7E4_9MARC